VLAGSLRPLGVGVPAGTLHALAIDIAASRPAELAHHTGLVAATDKPGGARLRSSSSGATGAGAPELLTLHPDHYVQHPQDRNRLRQAG